MKVKINKFILFIVVVFSFLFVFPLNVNALSNKTTYVNINNSEDLTVGKLSFSNILFKNFANTSTKAFGLSSNLTNSSDNYIYYNLKVYFYDNNYNIIAVGSKKGNTVSGTSSFLVMFNLNILGSHSVDEISYYQLVVDTIDDDSESSVNSLTPSTINTYKSYAYVIDAYDINILVNENNTFDVTEKIKAYFNTPKHGIFRKIPLKNTVTRLDGTVSTNHARITNISVDNEYKVLKEDNTYKIQIGASTKTLIGGQSYIIKYNYDLGRDPIKSYDELYYNLIGNEWDTVIGNVTFSIIMPKSFESSKLGFSLGRKGSTDNDGISYNVVGNKITGNYNGILDLGSGLTVRCELPEGYFTNTGYDINIIYYFLFLIPVLFLILSIFLWYKYGRDNKVVETAEFSPLQGFNSLEIGFLYKGEATSKDVTSLLIYLANKGYIKIVETNDTFEYGNYKIVKLKEYDGNNINEQNFLNGLFEKKKLLNKNSENSIIEVTPDDLYNSFYHTMNDIKANINSVENKRKIFEKSSLNKKKFIVLMLSISYLLITLIPILLFDEVDSPLFILGFPFSILAFMVLYSFIDVDKIADGSTNILSLILAFIFCGALIVILWLNILYPILSQDLILLVGNIVGMICIVGMAFCLKYLPKRTPYGNEMLGKLIGFRRFLMSVEKEKLESLVIQNPTYFYDILPYTYVLNISDKWIKKFESISLKAPMWYAGFSTFDMTSFGSFMTSAMTSAESVMSSYVSSSSGGSSGGGSSGGGSGGGGGGSW